MKLGCYWRWLQTLENESRLIKSAASLRAGSSLVPYAFDKNNRREDSGGPQSIILEFPISKALAMPRQLPPHVRKQLCPLRFRSHAPNKMGQWEKTNQFGRGKKHEMILCQFTVFLFIYFRMWISTKEGSLYACFYAHINNVQGLSSTRL